MPRPTRTDVARIARVSEATVSRALSARVDLAITRDTRARVLAAAEALGYRPNPTAQALAAGRTQIIGLWMCLDYSRYRAQVVDRMQRLLRRSDYCMAITDIEEEIGQRHSFTRASRVPVDGVIAFDTPTAGSIFARDTPAEHPCFVSMGAYWDTHTHFVGVDL
ncbi:MAG TPA: LacI family DNA-binding transcriptional regulator, partial [Chthonomonadaceae bacterium]|nr:LacI family DNA-binding transcriptional regulator [Chthonomonadaceae bacterium]